MTKKQEAMLLEAEALRAKTVNPETNQPGNVPEFQPVGVSGYNPKTGEVDRSIGDAVNEKVGAFVTGATDLPIVGPAMKAGVAGVTNALTGGGNYDELRQRQESVMAENPNTALAGRVAGSLIAGGPKPFGMGKALPIPGSALTAAGLGGAVGGGDTAVRSAIQGELPDPTRLAVDTAVGAAGGLVGHYIGKAVQHYLEAKGFGSKPLTEGAKRIIEERRSLENAAGDAMDASNVVISKDAINDLAHDVITKLAPEGLGRQSTPDAWKAAKMLLQAAGRDQDMTLRQFNLLRQNMRDALPMSASGTENHFVNVMGKDMNDFIINLPAGNPNIVRSGDAMAGVQAWRDMNKFTVQKMKGEALARLFYNSESEASKGGKGKSLGQILQDNADSFLTRTSGKAEDELSLFQPHEIKALEDFVKGNKSVAFDNMLEKYIGSGIVSTPFRAAIRGGAHLVKGITGGGDAATRAAGFDLLRAGGASASLPLPAVPTLTPAAADLAATIGRHYEDTQSRIDMILDAERRQSQPQQTQAGGGLPQGFPKSTVVPPPQMQPQPQ